MDRKRTVEKILRTKQIAWKAKSPGNLPWLFPDRALMMRLAGSILKEIDDDWWAAHRRYFIQDINSSSQIRTG